MKRSRPVLCAAFLALLLHASVSAAQELGRLFFTPEQREALDARRRARVPDKPAAAVVATPTLRLDGFVKRSSGRSTVWVNGESSSETAPGEAPRIRQDGSSVSVNLGDTPARVELKPGEVLDRGNGEVHDLIGEGEIKVGRKPK
jgi:hypothetical protein